MPVREMPAFVRTHKEVRQGVIFSLLSCVFLILQLILMKKNAINVVFDVIIPVTAAVTFACYSITMAYDRPVILICPPTIYFVSLLVNQLISVEVGVGDTYPYIVLVEMIPYIFFSVSAATDKGKKLTRKLLKVSCVILILGSIAAFILSAYFKISVFHSSVNVLKSTFGMISSFIAILFIYLCMDRLLIISGQDKRVRIPRKKRISQTNVQ